MMGKNIAAVVLASAAALLLAFPTAARQPAVPVQSAVVQKSVWKTDQFASSFVFDSINAKHLVGLAVIRKQQENRVSPFIYDTGTKKVNILPAQCRDKIMSGDDARRLLSFPVKVSPDKKKLLCSNGLDLIIVDMATGKESRITYDEMMKHVRPKERQPEFHFTADWGYDSRQLIVSRHWVNGHRFGTSAVFVYTVPTKAYKVLNIPETSMGTPRTVLLKALDAQRLLFLSGKDLAVYNLRSDAMQTITRLGKDETIMRETWTPEWLQFDTFSDGKRFVVRKYNSAKNKYALLSVDLVRLKVSDFHLKMDPSEQLLAYWDNDTYLTGNIALREYMNGKDKVSLHYYDKGKTYTVSGWGATKRSVNVLAAFKAGGAFVVNNTNDNETVVYTFRQK